MERRFCLRCMGFTLVKVRLHFLKSLIIDDENTKGSSIKTEIWICDQTLA